MKYPENILAVAALSIDMMGFIFYPSSLRYAGLLDPEVVSKIPSSIQKVGVFVNETVDNMLEMMTKYGLQIIQLHGNETPDTCCILKSKGYLIIKAFNIESAIDFSTTIPYGSVCDYFLFDTKSPLHGGSGKQYDWNLLNNYTGKIPFFLSGGISPEDVAKVKTINHPMLYALDLNSRFEIAPGRKDKELLAAFIRNF